MSIKHFVNIFLLIFTTLFISGCYSSNIPSFNWQWANPPTTSNNLYAVNVFDTLNIWAFGELGTMIKTSNFGENWSIYYQDYIIEDINDCYFFNDKKGIVICSEGKIYKTDNQCIDWYQIASPTTKPLNRIFIMDNGLGFIVGDSGIILKSIDGGNSWRELSSEVYNDLNSICVSENNTILAVGDEGIILKSKDLGESWSKINFDEKINFSDVSFLSDEHNIIIGPGGNILESYNTDGVWVKKIIGRKRDLHQIFRISKDSLFIAGRGLIPKTVNGGKDWVNKYSGSLYEHYSIDFYDNKFGCLAGENGSLAVTKNGNLFRYFTGRKRSTFKNLFDVQLATDSIFLAVGWNGSLIHSTNYGNTIMKRSSKAAIEYRGLHIVNPKIYWAVGNGGGIRFSSDSGKTFKSIHCSVQDSLNDIFFLGERNAWIVGNNGTILKSNDSGMTWENNSLQNNYLLKSIFFIDSLQGYIVGNGGVFLSSHDGGLTWERIKLNTINNLNKIYFNNHEGWIVGDNGLLLKRVKSKWNVLDISQTVNFNSIDFSIDQTGWIVGEKGLVLYTKDNGKTWIKVMSRTKHDLYGVNFYSENSGIIVGLRGVILTLNKSK